MVTPTWVLSREELISMTVTSLPIEINFDLEIFKVKRFVLNHEESLGKSESLFFKKVFDFIGR